ncbi:hypothetical protein EV421DRAFT_1909183 [Armillaria borealis]|uniref:Uncharacterized protein n=1 Tax=Armillaria borealis TaxID=47425 RepID=A0AA39J356_9AGAR|nr:hypothetical protein EV421DRAFT_1909183 [Armillaria borealis]
MALDRGRCLILNCSCSAFARRTSFLLHNNQEAVCVTCSHGIHAHADFQSAVVNQFLPNECFAFVQQTAEACTCTAQLVDHVPVLNPYRVTPGSSTLRNNSSDTVPSQQSSLAYPVYASIGVPSVWPPGNSNAITVIPYLPYYCVSPIVPPLSHSGSPPDTAQSSTSAESPAGPPRTLDQNDGLVQHSLRPHGHRIRPYPGPLSDNRHSECLRRLSELTASALQETSSTASGGNHNTVDTSPQRRVLTQQERLCLDMTSPSRGIVRNHPCPINLWICFLPLQCLHCYHYLLQTNHTSVSLAMCQNTCHPRQLQVAQDEIVPSIRTLRDIGLAFSLPIWAESINANIWKDLHRGIMEHLAPGGSLAIAGLNPDLDATPADCGWCIQTHYMEPADTPNCDQFRYIRAANPSHEQDITLSNVKKWCFKVGPDSPLDLDPFHPNLERWWTLFVAPSMANVHGSLSQLARYRSDLQFPYENMVEVKRNRQHSCYPDTVLSLLPFFRRNSGLSETADLNQFPPFVQCRVASARPQEGIAGRPYRTLCPRNPYTDDQTDGEDDGFFGWSDTSSCGSSIESIDDEASSSFWTSTPIRRLLNSSLALSPLPRPAEDQDNTAKVIRHALRAGFITRTFQIGPDPPAFPRWHVPADAKDIFAAQRRVQQRPSRSLPRSKALIFEARTSADAGWTTYVCLTEFYRRCWDMGTNMPIHGPPDESNFPQLPVAGNQPPHNWYSLGAYTNPHPTILSAPTAEETVGLGVNIQCHSAMVDSILSSTRYIDSRFGDFRVPSFTSRIYNPADLALWRADGASFALYAAYTGFPINRLHPLFFLALLPPPGSDPLRYFGEITGPILQTLDRQLCDAVRAWFHLMPTDPIGRTLGDPVPQALMMLDTELQPHHIGLNHPRTAQDHVIQTQDLLSDLVVRNTDFWRTDAFAQMRLGFHQVFYDREPELTIPRAFTDISCGPISAVAYLYDCEPCSSSEIMPFIDISRSTPLLPLLPDLQGNFRRELEAFLTADISRSKALLYILTGNRNIPRWNPVFKLRFEFEILSTPGSIFIHSCLNTATISWDSTTQMILSGSHPVLTPELWLETMFTGEAGYNSHATCKS